MLEPITIRYPIRPARRSLAVGQTADLFGLSLDEPPHTVAENLLLDIRPKNLVLFTGPSGSGKSSIMRAVALQLNAIDAAALELPDVPLVDALPGPVNERLAHLAACGLGEARLLLRTPSELSDGQRYRFRIAFAIALVAHERVANPSVDGPIVLDEFGANLDRTLAKVLAFNLRKLVNRLGISVLCATTHEDLTDDLAPDVWVRCRGEGEIEITDADVKKNLAPISPSPRNRSASLTNSGFPTVPVSTGRISLGGITAPITLPTPAE